MNSYGNFLLELLREENLGDILFSGFREMNDMLSHIDWPQIMKIVIFIALAGGLTIMLLVANDRIFARYNAKRIKKHHLTIRNNGNVPSIFLFRTIDLPKQLAIRFRVGDMPMIWVSRKNTPIQQPEEVKAEEPEQVSVSQKASTETALVPDLKNPFSEAADTAGKAASGAKKAVTDVGKKAGFIAGIISSFTSLFGIKSDTLSGAQGSLKNVQQQSNEMIQTVNSKAGTAETLTNQVKSIVPEDSFRNAANGAVSGTQAPGSVGGAEVMARDTLNLSQPAGSRDLVFDEDVWRNNIGKVDEKGGDLNYAMSKTLEPGESLKIDLDIMNISNSSAPISLMYKIEVVQIPQTKLQLAAPKEYVNGIVIYPKISVWSRIIPYAVIIALIIISLQLLAGYSHLIF
ncbi:MAG: hypothetical protein IJI07_12600 [Flexilinea sp.]|nr:hypothetical protein [Flexilinea sp.]